MLVWYMNWKEIGKVFTNKFAGTGPSSYKRRIYRAALSLRLRNTDIDEEVANNDGYGTVIAH